MGLRIYHLWISDFSIFFNPGQKGDKYRLEGLIQTKKTRGVLHFMSKMLMLHALVFSLGK